MIKRLQKSLIRHLKTARDEESGVVLLFAVVAGATLAASVATAVLLNFTGPRNEINNIQGNSAALEKINQAIVLFAIQDANYRIPCPADGTLAAGTSIACTGAANSVGTVPWATLGLSSEDALDAYGNKIVYAVSIDTAANLPSGACHELDGVPTGSVNAGALFAGDAAAGSATLYALVSQGPSGLGTFSQSGNATTTAPMGTGELENCPLGITGCTAQNTFIDTGPHNDAAGSGLTFFDDEVFVADRSDFATECQNFADMNKSELEFVEEGFGGTSVTTDLVVTNNGGGGGGSSSLENGTLVVTEDVEIATTSTLFTPSITPLYNRIEWTPTAATTDTGFSIITRADRTTRAGSTSNYTDGITCEFFGDGLPANAQTIEINDSSSTLATSGGTYTLTLDLTYELECFDDGNNVWARITEVGNTSNQATVFATNASDLATPNQVIFLHSATSGAVSTLDNLLVAKGGIALELDNAGTLANTTSPLANLTSETNFTKEGWLYLRDTAASTASLFFVDDGISSSESRFQADVANSESEFSFVDFDTTTGSIAASSQTYGTTFWRHQSFNCNSGSDRSLYAFGAAVGTADSVACDILPGTDIATATETVSVVNNTGGRILLSEMRLWSNALGSSAIASRYSGRIPDPAQAGAPATPADLHYLLRLEDGFASPTATDFETANGTTNFTVTGGRFVGFKAPFKTLAEDVCPGNEDTATPPDPFKCVWDGVAGAETTDTISIPFDVTDVRIKVWGAGGGGGRSDNQPHGRPGGGGGFTDGRLTTVGGTSIVTHSLNITAGGAGQQALTSVGNGGPGPGVANDPGGGGGGSSVQFDNNGTITLIAVGGGGGGGGSHRANATAGYGGGGGGAAATGEVRGAPGTCDPLSGTQAGGGAGHTCPGDSNAGGNVNLLNGADGGDGEDSVPNLSGGAGGTGYGNGGLGGRRDGTQGGGGGGGGYTGGGGGGKNSNALENIGGGGGASGFHTTDGGYTLGTSAAGTSTNPELITATTLPGGDADTDRGSAAAGGAISSDGSPGRVVICWSAACLP